MSCPWWFSKAWPPLLWPRAQSLPKASPPWDSQSEPGKEATLLGNPHPPRAGSWPGWLYLYEDTGKAPNPVLPFSPFSFPKSRTSHPMALSLPLQGLTSLWLLTWTSGNGNKEQLCLKNLLERTVGALLRWRPYICGGRGSASSLTILPLIIGQALDSSLYWCEVRPSESSHRSPLKAQPGTLKICELTSRIQQGCNLLYLRRGKLRILTWWLPIARSPPLWPKSSSLRKDPLPSDFWYGSREMAQEMTKCLEPYERSTGAWLS
jgi:hypothetical protein